MFLTPLKQKLNKIILDFVYIYTYLYFLCLTMVMVCCVELSEIFFLSKPHSYRHVFEPLNLVSFVLLCFERHF